MTTITGNTSPSGTRRWSPWKLAAWAAPALFMLAMLVNNQLTDEEGWSLGDFVFATVIFYGALGAYEMVARTAGNPFQRAGVGAGILALVALLWGNAAHGITITDADAWYLAVLAVGIVGLILGQMRPAGPARAMTMARGMFATALTMAAVSAVALIAGKVGAPRTTFEVVGITGFYVALFAGSALLFWAAAKEAPERAAE